MLDTYNMAEQLSGEYKTAFEMADVYSSTLRMADAEKDERMMELYDMLMEAESEGKSVGRILGGDIETFCKNYFEHETTAKERVKEIAGRLNVVMIILLISTIIDLFWAAETSNIVPITVGLFVGAIVDAIARFWLQPLVMKRKMKPMVYYLLVLFFFFITIVGLFILFEEVLGFEINVNPWVVLIISGSYIVIYCMTKAIRRFQQTGKFAEDKTNKKMVKEFNRDVQAQGLILPSAEGMEIRFKRYQKRRAKKGEEYTFAEFAAKLRKESSSKLVERITGGFLFVFVIVVGLTNGETIMDGLIFTAFLGVIEFLIWRWMIKNNRKLMKIQMSIVEECEEKGIDIIEFVEEIKKID